MHENRQYEYDVRTRYEQENTKGNIPTKTVHSVLEVCSVLCARTIGVGKCLSDRRFYTAV